MKNKLFLSIILGICLSVISTANVFADSNSTVLEKQKEIDTYIFEDHHAEIAEMGITVTHTAPLENEVEIGITPYNEENANYFYELFGENNVKVVEGQQATTLSTGVSRTDISPLEATVGPEKNQNTKVLYLSVIALAIVAAASIFIIRNKKVKG